MTDIANRPVLNGQGLDTAIEHARAALAALLRVPVGGDGAADPGPAPGDWGAGGSYPGHGPGDRGAGISYLKMIAEARALLGALLEHRLALLEHRLALLEHRLALAGRTGERDLAAIAAVRTDRNEAIAVHAALLYWLPADDPAWPDVAMTVGRLSYDRYSDAWPDAEAPDPDDLDAACDLLLRAAPSAEAEADERTARYLVLALRDRQRLLACPADTSALMIWGERLLAFPGAGGLGRADLHDLLELELINRAESLAQAGSWGPEGLRSLRLTVSLV